MTLDLPEIVTAPPGIDVPAAQQAVRTLLDALGADTGDQHVEDTPRRVVAALAELLTPVPFRWTVFPNSDGYQELIVTSGIPFTSLCAHHLLPFRGHATVGYLPGKHIVGLSKLGRAVEHHARSLQVQERLTIQIGDWLHQELRPRGVGIVLTAEHQCMSLRGLRAPGTLTTTSYLSGELRDSDRARTEFLQHSRLER